MNLMHKTTRKRSPMSGNARYVVSSTGESFGTEEAMWCAPDGAHLNLSPGQGLDRASIVRDDRSLWRYRSAIRVDADNRISLGEGWTPLVQRSWNGSEIEFKLEYLAPTGSFKDRGMAVMITYLHNVGLKAILEDSSGNAGASMSAYSAAAGISCRILVPAAAPKGKIVQIASMGADVSLVPGTRQDVADQALKEAKKIFYASHNWQPFFLEGTKTLAFEIWEQQGFSVPDAVVVPLGYGSNVLGLWLGFHELMRAGEVERLPRIYAVQAANCAPFAAALRQGADHAVPFTPFPTVADGIASVHPVRVKEVLSAISESGGALVTVSEEEIKDGLRGLLSNGLFVEPTSASVGAALTKLQAGGALTAGERVIAVLTGSGLKAADRIGELVGSAQGND
jgi:threonine synthase